MTKYFSIPTWLITVLFTKFGPRQHPWHGTTFTLQDWSDNETTLSKKFDLYFWIHVIVLCILIPIVFF